MAGEPLFLELGEVIQIHADQLARYGGESGLRDAGALESAIAMPASGMGETYFHADLCEMAAAYLFHLNHAHAFVDGNKRVAAVAAFVFLRLNGLRLTASNEVYEALVLTDAQGKSSKAAIADFFRVHTSPRSGA
jgi:death-on-curing protein